MQDFGISSNSLGGWGGGVVTTTKECAKGDIAFCAVAAVVAALTTVVPAALFGGPF